MQASYSCYVLLFLNSQCISQCINGSRKFNLPIHRDIITQLVTLSPTPEHVCRSWCQEGSTQPWSFNEKSPVARPEPLYWQSMAENIYIF